MVNFRNMSTDGVWFYAEAWDMRKYPDKEVWEKVKARTDFSMHSHQNDDSDIMQGTWYVILRYIRKGKKLPKKTSTCWEVHL